MVGARAQPWPWSRRGRAEARGELRRAGHRPARAPPRAALTRRRMMRALECPIVLAPAEREPPLP